ncbi:hypothetical protein SAMN05444358_10657 [Ruegeria halocynthiae]|uniref:Domain of unknwon function n=1 Tax=Ruegeria halocynthiae TaxID=985054 RepID=A0A1H3BYB5_9RHOB|nr:hypothetical protein [Ruegeria halocynthiae]SDX46836.1 hypothetical protein SAMN05444358_10657 [Ruegeria halocynthiae]
MHQKFIALIIATAVFITGLSASQARAADTRDILGGLAAIAIIGAAVNHYHQEKKRDEEAERRKRHKRAEAKAKKAKKKHKVRPLPNRVARYDLPYRCLRTFNTYSPDRQLLGPKCLKKHYKYADSLPHQCKVGFWNGKKVKRAYEPACLRQNGYRVVYQ